MRLLVPFLLLFSLSLAAQEARIAVIGLLHLYVSGYLPKMVKGEPARLVGIAEANPELIEEARKLGGTVKLSEITAISCQKQPIVETRINAL